MVFILEFPVMGRRGNPFLILLDIINGHSHDRKVCGEGLSLSTPA